MPVAEKFVEQHRGLTFKSPVKVTVLDDAAFRKQLLADNQDDPTEEQKSQKELRALGLIPPGLDLSKAENTLLGGAVSGYYDSKAKALFVRGVQPTPYVRRVIVHELTHALQDQYFNLDRPDLAKANDERYDGFQGLFEGDAVRVDTEYYDSLPASERRQSDAEEEAQGGSLDPNIPDALVQLLGFPYQVGPAFTEAVIRAGGMARLNAAFTNPPTTSEQLIHPAKFLAGEGAKPVGVPAAGGKVFDTGVLGELGFDVTLAESQSLSRQQVAAAVAGWGGDQYVAWDQGSQSCIRDNVVMDTSNDNAELFAALQVWAAHRKGVTVTGTGPITLTACG